MSPFDHDAHAAAGGGSGHTLKGDPPTIADRLSGPFPISKKLRTTWGRVVRSPIPKRGEAYLMLGDQFEDGLYRVIVGYDVSPETVAELEAAIEDRELVQRKILAINALLNGEGTADA